MKSVVQHFDVSKIRDFGTFNYSQQPIYWISNILDNLLSQMKLLVYFSWTLKLKLLAIWNKTYQLDKC